jgi:hypothetical protein
MAFEQQAECQHCRASFRVRLDISETPVDAGTLFTCDCVHCGKRAVFPIGVTRETEQSDDGLPLAVRAEHR